MGFGANKKLQNRFDKALKIINKNKKPDKRYTRSSLLGEIITVWTDSILGPEKDDE